MSEKELFQLFKETFGNDSGAKIYFAPGRVNLIGDHTDYNGGHALPCALTIGTYAVARKREDKTLCFYSANFEEDGVITVSLEDLDKKEGNGWTNYPKGIIWTLMQRGMNISNGMDLLYYGNIPDSAGLSSSASIEVLTAYICKEMFALCFDMIECAKLCQYSENKYNEVACGIMDQFVIAKGRKKNAIFLNTTSLDFEYVPLHLGDAKIVIMNTNKKRGLGDSQYNKRRNECEQALELLKQKKDIQSLGDLTKADWEECQSVISDEVLRKRARHAVFENIRTIEAVEALKREDITAFGELMNQSHDSLQKDYEVTGMELDTLVHAARETEGVIGARMTGAGFGGCAVCLVKKENASDMIDEVGKVYEREIGYPASFYAVNVGDGPKVVL